MRVTLVRPRGGYRSKRSPLGESMAEVGAEVDVLQDGDDVLHAPSDVVVLMGSAGWYPATMRWLTGLPAAAQPRVLLWLTEPLPPPRASGLGPSRRTPRDVAKIVLRDPRVNDQRSNLAHALEFARAVAGGTLVASTLAKVETLAEHGIVAPFVPLGVRPARPGEEPEERDVEVLFIGDPAVPHRRKALRFLDRAGIGVTSHGAWHPTRGLWGDERAALLRRSILLLNVSRHPGNAADARLALGAAHGVVTVSEPMYRPDPWVAGIHYEEAPLAELPDLIRALLADDARRATLAAAAAALAGEHTGNESARRLLALAAAPAA